jgi:ribosomal-protein-serine acetyltransferase
MAPSIRFRIDSDLELRLLEERDAGDIFALVEQNRSYLREWLPWVDFTRSVEDERAYIRSLQAQYLGDNGFACGIWYQKQITGTISYHPIDRLNSKVEIGYWLAAPFQGKGIMTRACRVMVDHAFDKLSVQKVVIRCALGNTRSCAIPQRLGFRHEGIVKQGEWLYDHFVDLNVFGMFADEWRAQHNA